MDTAAHDRAAAHAAALELFFSTEDERAEHEARVRALVDRNTALRAVEAARPEGLPKHA